MYFHGFLAWFDDGFEAKRLFAWVFSRVGFSRRKLPDGVSEKVKAHVSLVGGKRVRYSGFRWTEDQSHRSQPFRLLLGGFLYFLLF